MAVWMVRAGRHGEREDTALDNNLAVVGWYELPDLSSINTREQMEEQLRVTYPDIKPAVLYNNVGQLWAFCGRIQVGDLIALPLKTRSAIAIGRVTGPYTYRPDLPPDASHARPVD
jgi:restriction system protein